MTGLDLEVVRCHQCGKLMNVAAPDGEEDDVDEEEMNIEDGLKTPD